MTRAGRRTAVLVAVVAALGLAAIGETLRDRRNAPHPLLSASPARVDAIALDCGSCVSRRFQRIGGRWMMTAPWNIPADATQIARVVALANAPVRRRFAAARLDPHTLGLAPAFASVRLGDVLIEFGTTEPIDNLRYVRAAGVISLIPDRVSMVLLAPPEHFVDPAPLAGVVGGAVRVDEQGLGWTTTQREALMAWRAERVEAAAAFPDAAARVFTVHDRDGAPHRYALLLGAEPSLVRELPLLRYVLPADTRLPPSD